MAFITKLVQTHSSTNVALVKYDLKLGQTIEFVLLPFPRLHNQRCATRIEAIHDGVIKNLV